MDESLPVALDAMGGDFGVGPNVGGAIAAVREDGARVVLVGRENAVRAEIEAQRATDLLDDGRLSIHHAAEAVAMDEKPSAAARKRESSLRAACDLVSQAKACGAMSAGNTGALMATALFAFGRIDGVSRPAIATLLPSDTNSGLVLLIDAGANIDCEPLHLAQWAVLGSVLMAKTYGIERPRVGVLSNGEEQSKGTDLTRASLAMVRRTDVHAIGYVEGRDLNTGSVDVVITDGFTGNVMLKTAEGVFRFVTRRIREGYESGSWLERIGGALSRGVFARVRARLDPREYGAAPLVGLAKPAFVAHGSSDAYAIRRGIGAVRAHARADVVGHMTAAIARNAKAFSVEQDKSA